MKGVWRMNTDNPQWYDYWDEYGLKVFSLNVDYGIYINFEQLDKGGTIYNYIPEFPVATQDELTLFELETGYDLTGLIKLLKEKGELK